MRCSSDALYLNLLEDLDSAVPSYRGEPWPGMTLKETRANALSRSFYKKFVERKSFDADAKALQKFKSVNLDCSNFVLTPCSSADDVLLGELKSTLDDFWHPNGLPLVGNHHDILDHARCGPGSSVGARGQDAYTKLFASPLGTTSSRLYAMYSDYIKTDPTWSSAECQRQETYGDFHVVEGSKLSFAPKTDDISRLICVEPSLNMFFQLGLGIVLERRLRSFFGIDLTTQPDKNRELARRGSRDDSYCTIDLSSASDSLSLGMLHDVLPKSMYSWLTMLRSPVVMVPDGTSLELNMVSTMGNGFTFPLQTAVFSAIVVTAMRICKEKIYRPRGERLGNFSVFGDDIICTKKVQRCVYRLLDLLGFVVNRDKSFVEGPFRESCGRDYYHGEPVRGVYIKALQSTQDRYVAINRLNLWSAMTGIPLSRTIGYLLRTVPFTPVPPDENEDAGIKVPFHMVPQKLIKRCRDRGKSVLYRSYRASTKYIRIELDSLKVPSKSKSRIYNPDGLLLSFLNGNIRKSKISVRHDRLSYSAKWQLTPNWDWLPNGQEKSESGESFPVSEILSLSTWRQWDTAVSINHD